MHIHSETLCLDTGENIEISNLTPRIESVIASSGISHGFAIISSRHTTTALFVNEFEERLLEDIKTFFRTLVPANKNYLHNDIHLRDCPPDEPENAHSHIMAMLLSNCEIVPLVDRKLAIGQWQSIMFAELDGPRKRTVQVQIVGESE
ncbi:secondary thiamine-phosphate synthase enzyme YjbQ [Kaarinaea lacus]